MFKKIPGNNNYLINLNCDIIDSYGKKINLKQNKKGNIKLCLFNVEMNINIKLLSLLAWYECDYISNLDKNINNIVFIPMKGYPLRLRCGYLMKFVEPILYNDTFRFIPNYTRYAINIRGDVLDVKTNLIVSDISKGDDGYIKAYLWNPDKNGNRNIALHRLMALSFLPNDDFTTKPFVNHLNGNKEDYSLTNLEWCSSLENARHAVLIGLHNLSVKMKVRDSYTGNIKIYGSVGEMSNDLGMSNISAANFDYKLPGYRWKGRYEIKRLNDDTPWFYEHPDNKETPHGKSIYTITAICKETGEIKKFNSKLKFCRYFRIRPPDHGGIEAAIYKAKNRYPNKDFSYVRNALKGPYRLIDIKNNKITIFDSIKKLSISINKDVNEIRGDLFKKAKFIYNKKWIIIHGSINGKVDYNSYVEKPTFLHKMEIIDVKTNVVCIVRSSKEAMKKTGIPDKTIRKYLQTGGIYKNFKFRPIE